MKLRAMAYSILLLILSATLLINDGRLPQIAPPPTLNLTPTSIATINIQPTVVDHIRTLTALYSQTYASRVNNRDVDGVYNLMLDRLIPLCVTTRTESGADAYCGQPSEWINYFSTLNFDYELTVSTPQVSVIDGAAITVAGFNEQIAGQSNAFGTDVFMYLQTPDGWKLATMTVVLTDAENTGNFVPDELYSPSPTHLIDLIVEAFNQQDSQSIQQNFQRGAMVFDTTLIEENRGRFVSVLLQRVPEVFLRWFERGENIRISVDNIQVEIHDNYAATASTYYTLYDGDTMLETGQQLWTFIASDTSGWQVSALVFSPDDR